MLWVPLMGGDLGGAKSPSRTECLHTSVLLKHTHSQSVTLHARGRDT